MPGIRRRHRLESVKPLRADSHDLCDQGGLTIGCWLVTGKISAQGRISRLSNRQQVDVALRLIREDEHPNEKEVNRETFMVTTVELV